MTSQDDEEKRRKRGAKKGRGKNSGSQSGGTPRPRKKGKDNPLDGFNDNPKRDRRK